MSAQSILNILQEEKSRQDLLHLIQKRIEIENHIASYSDDIKDIETHAIAMGLKKSEFYNAIKWHKKDPELLMNELAFLEALIELRAMEKEALIEVKEMLHDIVYNDTQEG